MLRGDLLGGRGRSTEEDLRWIPVPVVDARTRDVEVVAVEVERRTRRHRSDAAKDRKELGGALVPLVMAEVVTEPRLLDRVPAGHDVQQQPPAGDSAGKSPPGVRRASAR